MHLPTKASWYPDRILKCLDGILQAGEFNVDNENILFNEFVLRLDEKGGRSILADIASNTSNYYCERVTTAAEGILFKYFDSKFAEFNARKRGFKIKKAV